MRRPFVTFLIATLIIASAAVPGSAQEAVFTGNEILFTGWRDRAAVYSVDPASGEQRRLTSRRAAVPVWSPARDRIAFIRYWSTSDWIPDVKSSLMVLDRDGTIHQLTDGKTNDFDAAWSPDGSRLVFSRYTTEDNIISVHLFVINADGSGLTELTSGKGITDAEASWSPDGSKIAFTHNSTFQSILIIDVESGETTALGGDPDILDSQPRWSPDGRYIAFNRYFFSNDQSDIYVADLEAKRFIALTKSDKIEEGPVWSPDGTEIAFVKVLWRDFNPEIFVKSLGGGAATRLTNQKKGDHYPVWSGDGSQIAFVRGDGRDQDVYLVSRDGGRGRRLTRTPIQESTLDW
ncbi:MAG TPA: hypothetical protein VNP73_12260 [Actinomycetota bacterium]|nr:hypothetical protein [Actinomycetota bacterium]